jgi:hypothetical protein
MLRRPTTTSTMHSRELVELAALIAVQAPAFIRGDHRAPQSACEEYWAASRCRLDRWKRLLRRLADASTEAVRPAPLAWQRIGPVLEEILASELLTRIWTAAAVAHDRAHDEADLEPIARNIASGHQEVRRRLLALLADGRGLLPDEAARLNHLRRRVERWCDMLLAHVAREVDITQFAFDPARAVEFASDLDYPAVAAERRFTCQLIHSSLRAAFTSCLADHTPNSDLNRRLAAAIVACYGDDLFAAVGLAPPLWLARMNTTADEAQQLIDELLAAEIRR